MQEQNEMQAKITTQDLILMQVQDLSKRMDRIEHRMDKLEEKMEATKKELNQRMDKQDEKIEKLADKIDQLRNDLRGSTGNISISNITLIGICLSVIYFVLTH